MPLHTQLIGQRTLPRRHAVDARWTMAYAAGLQDDNLRLRDTARKALAVHPLFPVALEWPSVLDSRALPGHNCLSHDELARGVHATHDLHVIKAIVPGQAYQTTATVVDLQAGQQGAATSIRRQQEFIIRFTPIALLRWLQACQTSFCMGLHRSHRR